MRAILCNMRSVYIFLTFYVFYGTNGGREEEGVVAVLGIRSFQKNVPIFEFFSVLYKKTEPSLRSFPFFIKECSDHCVLFCSF